MDSDTTVSYSLHPQVVQFHMHVDLFWWQKSGLSFAFVVWTHWRAVNYRRKAIYVTKKTLDVTQHCHRWLPEKSALDQFLKDSVSMDIAIHNHLNNSDSLNIWVYFDSQGSRTLPGSSQIAKLQVHSSFKDLQWKSRNCLLSTRTLVVSLILSREPPQPLDHYYTNSQSINPIQIRYPSPSLFLNHRPAL